MLDYILWYAHVWGILVSFIVIAISAVVIIEELEKK